ncbi:MAG TPA: thioesterase [Chromatiales bacterium]|nr:thioesterase [Chromatiales bacterium]
MKTRLALVFIHGLLGFDRLRLGPVTLDYFRGVRQCLADLPVDCYFPRLQPAATVERRARRLVAFLEPLGSRPRCLIGHSRGGIDARYVAAKADPSRLVRHVTTIGTPHRGTPLADWFQRYGGALFRPLVAELTTEACQRFNRAVSDREDIPYVSYAGSRPLAEMPLWYRPWTSLIARAAGDNDAQVPVSSACWGQACHVVRADHLELIGWSLGRANPAIERPFDHLRFYRHIAEQILDNVDGSQRSPCSTTKHTMITKYSDREM